MAESGSTFASIMRPSSLRARGDAARARQAWWLDAHYRRLLCERPNATAGDWLQYGHSLKEMGYFVRAERAYRTALALRPGDPEIHLQLGHLLKLDGRLAEAADAMAEAGRLGYADTGHIAFELGLIRAASASVSGLDTALTAKQGVSVYLSAPIKPFSEGSSAELVGLGGADYSYAFAMRGFIEALELLEIDYTVISNPEFIADIRERSSAAVNIHLAFYPPERVRMLKGAYNILCFAWEFERLRARSELTGYHAFADQATMLNVVDEIWTPSNESAAIVAAEIQRPVYYVPAPILSDLRRKPRKAAPHWREVDRLTQGLKDVEWQPLAVLPRIQGTMNGMAASRRSTLRSILHRNAPETVPKIFLTVLNVHDFRKQLRPMIEGFLQFSLEHPNAYLLIKMTTPDRGKLTINEFLAMDQISNAGRLVPPMVSDRIWITDQLLSRNALSALYDLADFYVCTSYAEGQNLPLLEAMGRGAVAVSVDVTAMKDYIRSDNAIVIRSGKVPAEPRLTTRYQMFGFDVAEVEGSSVCEALGIAVNMDEATYLSKSANAFDTVREMFGSRLVEEAVGRIVSAHQTTQEIAS